LKSEVDVAMVRDERSIAQLFGDSISELTKLVQNEVDLARAEIVQKLSIGSSAAKLIVGGAIFLTPGIVLVLLAVAAELSTLGLSQPLAYLIAGLGALIIAGVLVSIGMSRLSSSALKPSATLDQIRQDKAMAKELVR
jgi:Putative Actinobacterial Holin-X, holin superfamily III